MGYTNADKPFPRGEVRSAVVVPPWRRRGMLHRLLPAARSPHSSPTTAVRVHALPGARRSACGGPSCSRATSRIPRTAGKRLTPPAGCTQASSWRAREWAGGRLGVLRAVLRAASGSEERQLPTALQLPCPTASCPACAPPRRRRRGHVDPGGAPEDHRPQEEHLQAGAGGLSWLFGLAVGLRPAAGWQGSGALLAVQNMLWLRPPPLTDTLPQTRPNFLPRRASTWRPRRSRMSTPAPPLCCSPLCTATRCAPRWARCRLASWWWAAGHGGSPAPACGCKRCKSWLRSEPA